MIIDIKMVFHLRRSRSRFYSSQSIAFVFVFDWDVADKTRNNVNLWENDEF